jgi:glycosyltransferase involved in cell wall biosynthesis
MAFGVPRESLERNGFIAKIFPIVLYARPLSDDKAFAALVRVVKILKEIFNFRLIYDSDHSKEEYAFPICRLKKTIFKDVTIIMNHNWTHDKTVLDGMDFSCEYDCEHVLRNNHIPPEYAHKLVTTMFCTKRVMCPYADLSDEVKAVCERTEPFVFTGGKNRRDYTHLVEAANQLKCPLVICDEFAHTKHKHIEETAYVKKMSARVDEIEHMMKRALFVVCCLGTSPPNPIGITFTAVASMMGKAIVVTRDSGLDQYVKNGYNGLVCDNTTSGFKKAISLLRNDKYRSKMERNIDITRWTVEDGFVNVVRFIRRLGF